MMVNGEPDKCRVPAKGMVTFIAEWPSMPGVNARNRPTGIGTSETSDHQPLRD